MNTEYRKLKNLFLRQSCQDAWEDYARSIRKVNFPRWDYVILTSSNEEQARSFRSQIADRLEQGVLPGWTKYFVLPDPEGKRVGSGGATLNVLRFLSEEEGLRGDFHNKRILVIHSGGDSKRVPQYSVCGKLFSPVPRELPDGRGSTLFDEFLISMAGVPARFKEGMLVLSGDVLLLFNPLQIDAQFRGAAAISMKSPVEVGVDHGVFLNDGSDHVKMFLHKQPAETLRRLGAVNGQDCVDLDTGAVLLDAEILETLFSLIADASGKKADPDKYESFVNEKARVSFYGDFLYPLAADSTFEQYQKEKPEGEFCTELFTCREKIWKALSPFQMKLICLSPAEFIHFGTTRELRALMTEEVTDYEFLDWKKHVFTNDLNCQGALHTALIGPEADIEEGTYIEDTCLEGRTHVGKGAVVSGLSLKDVHIPANTVFHGVKLKDEITELYGGQTGRCVIRTYGVMDNPKKTLEERGSFLRGNLADFLSANGLEPEDIWTGETHALWNAKLYPVCKTFQEAAQAGNLLVKMSEGLAEPRQIESWKKQPRLSLEESFRYGNTENILSWKKDLEARILVAVFLEELKKGGHYIPALKIFGEKEIQERHYHLLMKEAEKADFSQKIRILYAVSRSMKFTKKCFDGKTYDVLEQECFSQIQKEIASQTQLTGNCGYTIAKEQVKVNLPVRVNWGGGWSDTPPYCNEHGGTVLLEFRKKYGLDGKFVIMYSGNIGLYYDLEKLIEVVERFKPGTKTADGREVVFAFVGAGSVLEKLKNYVKDHYMDNVVFIPYQDKSDLIYSLNAGDVHWCVNAKGIKGVSCPSKAYGIMAAAKPILGVLESGSEVRCLIEDTQGGLCCEPGEYDKVEENICWFIENAGNSELKAMGARSRENLEKNLTRNVSVRKYAEEILKM